MPECEVCGAAFEKRKRRQIYCSPKCYQRGWTAKNREKYNARARQSGKRRRAAARLPQTCGGCGKEFAPSHLAQKYCARSCHSRAYTKSNRNKVSVWRKRWANKIRVDAPWLPLLTAVRSRAKKLDLPCDLTAAWAAQVWSGRCAFSNIPFLLERKRHPRSPSIDRIIPSLGYVQNNCRFVLLAVNMFKHDWTDADIVEIAHAISTSHRDLRRDPAENTANT